MRRKAPKTTVYIASHNYGRYLQDAIESVLRQTVDTWELLIIDDKSADNTPDVIRLYEGDKRIRTFRVEGIGLPSVCNLALEHARGEYIIRLDGDDLFDENVLLVLQNHLDHHPDHALVFPDNYLIDDMNEIFAHERRHRLYDHNHVGDLPPNGACTLVRTAVLRECGGYREDLGAQDGFDLWSKVAGRYKSGNVNLPLFYYRRHSANLTHRRSLIMHARRQIKRDAVRAMIATFRPVTAVIPCRQNYDFAPDVWDLPLGGMTLLERALKACVASELIDHIVVACDNRRAEKVIEGLNDDRLAFFRRYPRDTIRSKTIVPTLEQIAKAFDPDQTGVTVLRYIQSPFVSTATLEEAIHTLVMNDADSSIGVEEIHRPVYRRSPHGMEQLNPRGVFHTDFDALYQEANTAFAARTANFRNGSLNGSRGVSFLVSTDECFFVDSMAKLEIAKIMEERT